MRLKILMATHAKASGTNPKPFPFIYFQRANSQHVGHDVKPPLQGLGVSHSVY
jgi:hypothetical protein